MSVNQCCQSKHETCVTKAHLKSKNTAKFNKMMRVLEKVSAVGLAFVAATTNLKLFAVSFALGVGVGIYQHITQGHERGSTQLTSACSQGFIESLTGVKLPPLLSLGANIAVTVCHIDHHSVVFVPIVGVSIGAWIGKIGSEYASMIFRKFRPIDIVSCTA